MQTSSLSLLLLSLCGSLAKAQHDYGWAGGFRGLPFGGAEYLGGSPPFSPQAGLGGGGYRAGLGGGVRGHGGGGFEGVDGFGPDLAYGHLGDGLGGVDEVGGLGGIAGPPSYGFEAELKGGDSLEIPWAPGTVQPELCVAPGTLVTFSWQGSYHNVVEVGSEDDLSSCTGATGRDLVGRAGPHVWQAPSLPGRHFFLCGVGRHCSRAGMKTTIRVAEYCLGKMEISWGPGVDQAERCVRPGSTVIFSWPSTYHNVVEVGSEDDLSSCTGATGRDLVGRAGPHVWQAPSLPGRHFFLCGVGRHCSRAGMKTTIRVDEYCSQIAGGDE